MIINKRILISCAVGVLALIISIPMAWHRQTGDTQKKIKQVESAIKNMYKSKGGINFVPDWNEAEMNKLTAGLTPENKSIARARALIYYDKNPMDSRDLFDKVEWDDRFKTGQQPWKIQSESSKLLSTISIAISIGLATMLAALLLLFIIPLIWFFTLKRISELSKAIQGKHGS